jgi:hypothetical protein
MRARVRYNEPVKRLEFILAVTVVAVGPEVAGAQQVHITAPTPPRERGIEGIIGPELQYELTQPDDARYLPPGPRVHHDPAFIAPLSKATESGRVGVAGWTSPTAAIGAPATGNREVTGYFAIGFAFEWGGPPMTKRPVR